MNLHKSRSTDSTPPDGGDVKQQQRDRARLLNALGIQHSKFKPANEEPRIEPAYAEDLPGAVSSYTPGSTAFQEKQVEVLLEELWQNRRNTG